VLFASFLSKRKNLRFYTAITDNCHDMNRCDWMDCVLEVGLFDGAPSSLLNTEAGKNIPIHKNRFISLCPQHFILGVSFEAAPTVRRDYESETVRSRVRRPHSHLLAWVSEKLQHLLFG